MSKNAIYGLLTIVAVVGIVVAAWYVNQRTDTSTKTPDASSTSTSTTPTPQSTTTAQLEGGQQMQSEDLVVGSGDEAVSGKTVTVNYVGTFTDGTKFDASADHGQPFSFTLGAGQVIQGWDQGVAGMKVGGKRKLTVPPELGYGPNDYGSIPGGSTLVFEIELLKVE